VTWVVAYRTGGYIRAEYTIKYGAVIVIFVLSGEMQPHVEEKLAQQYWQRRWWECS
jgi:hypothetical protein